MVKAFPVRHIEAIGGGQRIEGGKERGGTVLRAAEGQIDVRTTMVASHGPQSIELHPAELGEALQTSSDLGDGAFAQIIVADRGNSLLRTDGICGGR